MSAEVFYSRYVRDSADIHFVYRPPSNTLYVRHVRYVSASDFSRGSDLIEAVRSGSNSARAAQGLSAYPLEAAAEIIQFIRMMREQCPRDPIELCGWITDLVHVPDELLLPRREDGTQKAT